MDTSKVRFVLTYRSPNKDIEHLEKLCNLLDWTIRSSQSVIALGDFNFPLIKWKKPIPIPDTSLDFLFFTNVVEMGFYQAVENPTLDKNILDLILYSSESLVFDVHNLAPFSTSDHDSVEFKILSPFTQKEEDEKEARDFKKADYQQI